MRNDDLLAWAESWNWPQLVLCAEEHTLIRAGEASWRAWVANSNQEGKRQAWQRIGRWQKLAEDMNGKFAIPTERE